jgi:hypothetical protein
MNTPPLRDEGLEVIVGALQPVHRCALCQTISPFTSQKRLTYNREVRFSLGSRFQRSLITWPKPRANRSTP